MNKINYNLMAIISCGKLNINYLIPIIGGLIRASRLIAGELLPKKEDIDEKHKLLGDKLSVITTSVFIDLGMALAFIPFIILKYKSKKTIRPSEQIKDRERRLTIKLEYYDIYEKNRKSKYKLICFVEFLDISQVIFSTIKSNCPYNFWEFDILFLSLFTCIILKTKLYRHQYFSMIIIIILGLGLNVVTYFINEDNEINVLRIFSKILSELFISLCVVLNKYIMDKYFCSPYEVCMLEGSLGVLVLIFCICIIIIINIIDGNITTADIISLLGLDDTFFNIANVIAMFSSFFYNLSILVTIERLSACHVLLALIVHECYYYVPRKITNIIWNIIGLLLLVVMFITFLFFVEILEFNLFEVSSNTKKNIGIRADRDNDYVSGTSEIEETDSNEQVGNQSLTSILTHNTSQNENENL